METAGGIVIALAVVALSTWGLWRLIVRLIRGPRGPERHCLTCGHDGEAKMQARGSFAVEIVLWCFFIVPGLIYSVWRASTRKAVCAECGGEQLVPINAPAATSHRKALAG